MNYTEIIKLLDAGYTRDEILKMKDEPEPAPAPEPEPAPAPAGNDALLEEVKGMFNEMRKEFTAFNIMNSQQLPQEKTGEDIIANIINPTLNKEGK